MYKKLKGKRPGRPRYDRKVNFSPRVYYFKPQGVPLRDLSAVELSVEEMEAVRLKHIEKMDQQKCAEIMNTSQSTFQRILSEANEKMSLALVNGKAIRIKKEQG